MSEHAAAIPLPSSADSPTAEREAQIESARLASLGDLVRGTAHEINNPLFGMLGLVELLLSELEPGTRAHERLELVRQSGLEIKRITHTLLEFARAEPGVEEIVALEEVAAQAVELVRCTTAGSSVEIRELYPAEPLVVRVSPARVSQVFLALVLSARRALPDGGVVTVRLERDGDGAVASVSDDGVEREWSLELDAALDIARMHGGDLVALPASHAGATVVLRLPLMGAER
jgi:signal transduction histidine kinase